MINTKEIFNLFKYENKLEENYNRINKLNSLSEEQTMLIDDNIISLKQLSLVMNFIIDNGLFVNAIIANNYSFNYICKSEDININYGDAKLSDCCIGTYNGIPIYIFPTVPEDTIYFISKEFFNNIDGSIARLRIDLDKSADKSYLESVRVDNIKDTFYKQPVDINIEE